MPFYMLQVSYDAKQYKAMIDHPQDRTTQARKIVESFGGKLHNFFFAFGDYDLVAITEFPDNVSSSAAALALGSTGAFSRFKTTVLVTAAEAQKAMKKAGSTKSGYKIPSKVT